MKLKVLEMYNSSRAIFLFPKEKIGEEKSEVNIVHFLVLKFSSLNAHTFFIYLYLFAGQKGCFSDKAIKKIVI